MSDERPDIHPVLVLRFFKQPETPIPHPNATLKSTRFRVTLRSTD